MSNKKRKEKMVFKRMDNLLELGLIKIDATNPSNPSLSLTKKTIDLLIKNGRKQDMVFIGPLEEYFRGKEERYAKHLDSAIKGMLEELNAYDEETFKAMKTVLTLIDYLEDGKEPSLKDLKYLWEGEK